MSNTWRVRAGADSRLEGDVLHVAAIDMQILPDGESGARAGEERDRGGDILRRAQPADDAVSERIVVHGWGMLTDLIPEIHCSYTRSSVVFHNDFHCIVGFPRCAIRRNCAPFFWSTESVV